MTIFHTKIDDDAEEYMLNLSQFDSKHLNFVFNSAYKFNEPSMQISKLQATALQFFIKANNFKNIVEVGSFVGFSAFSMACVMEPSSELVSIEIDEEHHKQSELNHYEYLRDCQQARGAVHNISFVNSDAKDILPRIYDYIKDIDLFFLDGDKENYCYYLNWAELNLKSGAYFIVDNALFKGGVLNNNGKYAQNIRLMTEKLYRSDAFDYFFLPVGDCMIVAKKR
ncbi:class I SAM-dependent methyltransferase [Maridesulfovibrio sp.]|uniref:O-methyltransferase n=1 Tax=Maridesulfovibrio sp. TaxID=2795000 RepID=UPI0029CA8AC3|nr:class I SAM-dependent methyltransferase [Maridesulfovibrio sp.]